MKRWMLAAFLVAGAWLAGSHEVIRGQSVTDASAPLFDDTVLHRVDLWVNSRDWAYLKANFERNDYYPANFRWRGQTVRNVAIRSRGFGSRSATKPGLRVDFSRFTTGQRFLGLKGLVLDNLAQDASGLHEIMAMKLFRRLGIQAPREAMAALYVNNAYAGLYALVEEPDEVSMGRMFGDGSGYLHEYKWLYEYRFEDLGGDLARYRELFEPKTREQETSFALFEPIAAMVDTFNHAPDERFEEQAGQYLDLSRFVAHAAVQAYLSSWDGLLGYAGLNNFYLYRKADSRRFDIVPWDEDNAFGPLDYPVDANHEGNVLMRRLVERGPWRDAYYAAVLGAAASAEEEAWMESEILRLQGLVRERALADRNKPVTNEEFEAASAEMLKFARDRGLVVRQEIGGEAAAQSPGSSPITFPTTFRRRFVPGR